MTYTSYIIKWIYTWIPVLDNPPNVDDVFRMFAEYLNHSPSFSLFRFHLYIIKWDTYIGCSTEMPALYNLFGGSFYRTPHVNDCQRIHVCAPWKNERIIKFVLLQSVNIRHYWNRKGSVAQTDHFGWILWEVVFTLLDDYFSVELNLNLSNGMGTLAT